MRNVDIEKHYLEARQALSQTVSSFIAYLDQLESQLPLLVLEPQQARDLLHRLQPNISQKIFQIAKIPTRRFELKALAICIKETTRNNHYQTSSPKLPIQYENAAEPGCLSVSARWILLQPRLMPRPHRLQGKDKEAQKSATIAAWQV